MPSSARAYLPSKYGEFDVIVWPGNKGQEPVAVVTRDLDTSKPALVRIHSECLTGDVFGSLRCDCNAQKEEALKQIAEYGNGAFIYLRQEGRGMGLFDKIRSYKLQEEGVDTHQASITLGHAPDAREYSWALKIFRELGIAKIKLLTNNPAKFSEVFEDGIEVERAPLIIESNEHNSWYYDIKRKKFKHTFGEQEEYHFYGITYSDPRTNLEPLFDFIREQTLHPLLKIHIGIFIDHTILGKEDVVADIDSAIKSIVKEQNLIPVLHYSSAGSPDILVDLSKILDKFEGLTHIQINDASEDYMEALKFVAGKFTFVAPLSDANFDLVDNTEFVGLLTSNPSFLLLDNSKGQGQTESYSVYAEKITKCLDQGLNNIGVAGGFGADTLESYFKLKDYFKLDFSIDAESKLHTEDSLDMEKVKAYLSRLCK